MDTMTMTADEQTEADRLLAELHARGYVDTDQHNDLTPGTRIRHQGQQYPEAFDHGTAFIVAITHKPNSGWSSSWGTPDVEIVVVRDEPLVEGMSRLTTLAQYHVAKVS